MILAVLMALGGVVSGMTLLSSSNSAAGYEAGSCSMHVRGAASEILPRNSGYGCSTIASMLLVLPNAVGVWPLEGNEGKPKVVCRIYPAKALPLEIRCHQGGKHFDVVAKT